MKRLILLKEVLALLNRFINMIANVYSSFCFSFFNSNIYPCISASVIESCVSAYI